MPDETCAVHSFRFYCLRWSRSWSFAQAEDLERWLQRNRSNDHLHRSAHATLDSKHINGSINGSHACQKNDHSDMKKLWWYWTGSDHFLVPFEKLRGEVFSMGPMGRMGFVPSWCRGVFKTPYIQDWEQNRMKEMLQLQDCDRMTGTFWFLPRGLLMRWWWFNSVCIIHERS